MRPLVGFAAFGVFWGAWGAALPAVQSQARVTDAELGLALVLVAFGALVSMRATGVLLDRFGPRLTPLAIAGLGVAGVLPAFAHSPAELYVFLFALGAASGAMDVAINSVAVRAEVSSGRSVLNLAHAVFSAAVVVASLGTGAVRWAGGGPGAIFGSAAVVVLAAAFASRPVAIDSTAPPPVPVGPKLFQRVPGWLLVLGILGATALWIENAWQSWGAVHLERTFDASPGASALAPALFAGAMAVGRLAVHSVLRPGAERVVLVAGALTAAAGSFVAALAPSAAVALAGVVVAGAGCSVCVPVLVSIGGRAAAPHERATTVGSLTTLMYFGFLIGPAAVGGLAEVTSLRVSLAAVGALALVLALVLTRMRKLLLALVLIVLALAAVSCGGDDDDGVAGGTTTTEVSCEKDSLELVTPGQLTIGTDNPAFPPWFEGTKEFDPWDPTTTPTKKGYEQEVAYGIARELGFTDDEVKWVAVPFLQAFKPGAKSFDFDINQISFKPERAEAVDFSDSYYDVEQSIVALESNPIAKAKTLEQIGEHKLGAVVGTTSLEAINEQIPGSPEPSVYDTNNDVLSAIKAKQIDGGVVDFPTGLYMAAVQLDGGTVVGRIPSDGREYFGVVLEKDSPLTECVNEAIAALHEDGTIDRLEQKWLGGSAPVLE